MTARRSSTTITAWLEDDANEFPSQYGFVTHREWLEFEEKRIPGSVIVEENGYIALRKRAAVK
ncbi:MAG: hypothetical protein Q8Q12_00540 [bacterium]|nr:hypothetical protein [bacterium]